jgi:histone deacetylase 6
MPSLDFGNGGADGIDHVMEDAPNGVGGPNAVEEEQSKDNASSMVDDGDLIIEEYPSDNDDEEFIKSLGNQAQLPTGCCYDDRMKLHANADFGPSPHHPEDPRRIEEIMKIFKKAGLVYTGSDYDLEEILAKTPNKYMWRIPARDATKREICTVHTELHYDWVERLSNMSTQELRMLSLQLDQGRTSLYVGAMSFEAALLAAGGAIETCKNIVAGNIKNGFAIIRPPGHHAEYDQSMGFCLFNNVPIAAKICQLDYPEDCRKILILDWDVHHGNGIQNMFYDDPNILYISLHVYGNDFYPGKPDNPLVADGGIENVGDGVGQGKNVNIGWAQQGMGDAEYLAAFQKIVMPIGQEFNPDLVIISAGFDAADGDELGGCFVSPSCYAHMTHMLMSLAGGKVAVCLEGGYNLRAISQSALAVAKTLMGEAPPKMRVLPPIDKEASRALAKVQAVHAPYWQCMRPGVIDVRQLDAATSRLHDIIRTAQRQTLSEKFNMIPLYIQHSVLYKSFENQVLITPDIHTKRRILFIIHDP